MSFLSRIFGETTTFAQSDSWLVRMIGGGPTKAGVAVSEHTASNLPAVYACINRIANPIARFPLKILRRRDDGSSAPVTSDEHPFADVIGLRPNPLMSSRVLRKTAQGHALLWGNGYCEIERNGRGQAVGLWPLLPDRTRPIRVDGEHLYETRIDGQVYQLAPNDVIHVMDQSHDGFLGKSPIWHARQALGMAFAMEEYGAKFFANDAKSGGFLTHPGKLSSNAQGNIGGKAKDRTDPGVALEKQGGLENAHRIKVLEEGMKFVSTTIPPEDAQFLGSREFQIAEIARIYDVPLVLLQSMEKSTSWGSGIEQLMIGFVRQTIDPWVDAWEQELNWKLFTPDELADGLYVKFNMNAILRGDMEARAAFYTALFGVGGISPNMVLALEDMDGIGPDGDNHFVPANFVPISRAINPTPVSPQPPGVPGDPAPAPQPPGDGQPDARLPKGGPQLLSIES